MTDFRGVFPAIVTPMTQDGGVSEEALRAVMEFNIQSGVHGFWVAGGTGESILLDDEENNRIAEWAADQARGRIKNIMHVGAPNTRRAVAMAEHAAKAGVDAVCAVPPFFYRPGDEGVIEHYRAVGAAADLPLFLYNLPGSTGVEITVDLMKRIQDRVPQLAGLKHSSSMTENIWVFSRMGLACFTGSAYMMLPALILGGAGCVDSSPQMAPDVWVEIFDAFQVGDMARAERAQARGAEITDFMIEFGNPSTPKAVLGERLGVDCGDPRLPLLPMTPEQRAECLRKAAEMGLTKTPVAV